MLDAASFIARPSAIGTILSCVFLAACTSSGQVPSAAGSSGKGGPEGFRLLASVQGTHGRLEVLESPRLRVLACDGVIQTAVPVGGEHRLPGALIRGRDYVGLIPYYRPKARDALLIGLGAGLHVQSLATDGINVHSVDIERAVVPLAERYFGFAGEITVADGRAFLEHTRRQFDAIILDTFQGGTMPQHLYTKEAFEQASKRLRAGGVLVVHVIAPPQHPATGTIARTLGVVFPETVTLRSGHGNGVQHIYLFASRSPLALRTEERLRLDAYGFTGDEFFDPCTESAPVLTDDNNRLDQLCEALACEHRKRSIKTLGRTSW
jgi:hypothetical protein